jgi:superfamily II DNA helicase RecQ
LGWARLRQSGIVYCGRKAETVEVCKALALSGVAAAVYNADVESSEKSRVLRAWQEGVHSNLVWWCAKMQSS